MGAFISSFSAPSQVRVMMVGLDGAGKTTILDQLKHGEVKATIPTIGFNVETLQYPDMALEVYDAGGQAKLQPLWRMYYHDKRGFIFVVDASDSARIDEVAETLRTAFLNHVEVARNPILFIANKHDLPNALSNAQLIERLKLESIEGPWHIQVASAATGDGLHEGMQWLATTIKNRWRIWS